MVFQTSIRKVISMKSLVLFSYKQPVENAKFRWGVLESRRDTAKQPLKLSTLLGGYRLFDKDFHRSRSLDTVTTTEGVKCFYRERPNWGVKIPLVGSP
jgi:hypothetical protein